MANGPRWILAVEIVHDRDVARLQGRQQELNHPGEKALGVDQPVDHERANDTVTSQPQRRAMFFNGRPVLW
jgi:hypothetical protein